mmetsp:Transcript_23827/g.28772  ORF Transcript_23827/g.28772 Transcript_23827/m.28772 type:complete len:270 (-) Transcript_23827:868-1677(-)
MASTSTLPPDHHLISLMTNIARRGPPTATTTSLWPIIQVFTRIAIPMALCAYPAIFISFCMSSGLMFFIISAVFCACSLVMFIPMLLLIFSIISGEMFFIMSDIASIVSGLFICSCITFICSSVLIFAGSPPPGPMAPFIFSAIFIILSMASGVMFFIISPACFAISGVNFGIPAPPGAAADMASSCSGLIFDIMSDMLDNISGLSFIFCSISLESGIPVGGATGAGSGSGGASPGSSSPSSFSLASDSFTCASIVSSLSDNFSAVLKS